MEFERAGTIVADVQTWLQGLGDKGTVRSMSDVVQKLWGFCHTLRHDGIDYGDYIEQITFLLFLKMADEKGIKLPKGCDWPSSATRAAPA